MAGHFCGAHQQPFFKKGKMKGYAHPLKDESGEDTGEWCNEPEQKTAVPTEAKEVDAETKKTGYPERPQSQSISIEGQGALKALNEIALSDKGTPLDLEYCKKIAYWKLFTWTGIDPASIEIKPQPVTPPVTPTATKKESKAQPDGKQVAKTDGVDLNPPDKIKPETIETIKVWWDKNDGALKEPIKSYMAKELKRVKISDLTEPEGQQLLEALKSGIIKEEKS